MNVELSRQQEFTAGLSDDFLLMKNSDLYVLRSIAQPGVLRLSLDDCYCLNWHVLRRGCSLVT